MAMHTAKTRAYLTADGSRVVAEGDPEAATLYITPGREVDADEAERLGLVALDAQVAAATKAVEKADVEDKAAPAPRKGS